MRCGVVINVFISFVLVCFAVLVSHRHHHHLRRPLLLPLLTKTNIPVEMVRTHPPVHSQLTVLIVGLIVRAKEKNQRSGCDGVIVARGVLLTRMVVVRVVVSVALVDEVE